MKKKSCGVGLFMIMLVLGMPIYSASVLAASVQITVNEGLMGKDGFINADGDTWTVQALVSAQNPVTADKVKIKVGSNVNSFNSCQVESFGTKCEYKAIFASGVPPDDYDFIVEYKNELETARTSGVVTADGEGPVISGLSARQNYGEIKIGFTVSDPAGLKKVELLDGEGNVLQDLPVEGEEYIYAEEPPEFASEGIVYIKVRAEDELGHVTMSGAKSFRVDKVAPAIVLESLDLVAFGDFLGAGTSVTDILIDVREANQLEEVWASSEQANLRNTPAKQCSADAVDPLLWHCLWEDVEVKSAETILINVKAKDNFGNEGDGLVTKRFVLDTQAPIIEYFGTSLLYNEEMYVRKDGGSKIILKVKEEQGAGLDENLIFADLRAFSGGGEKEAPESCVGDLSYLECVWEVGSTSSSSVNVAISKLQDKAGNEGERKEISLKVDSVGPRVQKIALFGGENEYVSGGVPLKLELLVEEDTGLIILVNLNGLVDGAGEKFPEGVLNEAGWQTFTDVCTRDEESRWKCVLQTEEIMSGSGQKSLYLKVLDTAGNEAKTWKNDVQGMEGSNGNYKFNQLGVDVEEEPDYWEVKEVKPLVSFIDLDQTELAPMRMPFSIKLRTNEPSVEMIKVELVGCEAGEDAPALAGREILYGGVSAEGVKNPVLQLLMELEPFNGKEFFGISELLKTEGFAGEEREYKCNFQIFSKKGRNAFANPEIQEMGLKIPFAFSSLGAADENMEERIEEIKDDVFFQIADKLQVVNEILRYLNFFVGFVNIAYKIEQGLNLMVGKGDGLRAIPLAGIPLAVGLCETGIDAEFMFTKALDFLQIPLSILSCQPNAKLGWYGVYQEAVLKIYNAWSGRGLVGLGATDLRENIWTSAIGLCIPGILENLEEYRQVKCREILCYQNDIPTGLATVQSCKDLGEYLTCRYVVGNIAATAIPLISLVDGIMSFIKGLFTSPLGFIRLALQVPCLVSCLASNSVSALCSFTGTIVVIGDVVDSLYSAVNSWPGDVSDPYCSQIKESEQEEKEKESVKVEDLEEGENV